MPDDCFLPKTMSRPKNLTSCQTDWLLISVKGQRLRGLLIAVFERLCRLSLPSHPAYCKHSPVTCSGGHWSLCVANTNRKFAVIWPIKDPSPSVNNLL